MKKAYLALATALKNDPKRKSWIMENLPLFVNSEEHSDMFLTTYRIRNAYEDLLDKLELGEYIQDEKDKVLVKRYFDMMFVAPRKLNLTELKEHRDPRIKILRAKKDTRWEGRGRNRRPFEITLELDNGEEFQINPNDAINKFLHIRSTFDTLNLSNL
jgi:hypothetical protein